jgi:undecaprenyl-diphosphatase
VNLQRILELDDKLSQRIRVAEQPGPLRSLAVFLGHSGDSWFWLSGLLLLAIFGDNSWRALAIVFIAAILVTAVSVLILKFTIRRQRPEGELGQIYRRTDPHSFPSGHAARALLLGILALALGPTWFGVLLIIWGPIVGLARIAMGVHYVSDVLAGWVVGSSAAALTLWALKIFF